MKKALLLLILMALPLMAHAQVYKWKDANGRTIYSDVPPPSNVKQESIIGNKPVAPAAAPAATATAGAPAAASDPKKAAADKDAEARKRQEEAEAAKKKDAAKQAELELRQKNCAAAKSNYDLYKIGGRIAKVNDKGERVYLGDADIAAGLAQAQKEVDQYCN
jgi:type IV secretory pathway VirB10-like protein